MSGNQLSLFSRGHLADALRAHSDGALRRVTTISESVIRARPELELVDELYEELKIAPLQLDESNSRMRKQEVEIDVSGDPKRDIFPRGRKVFVPGIQVTVSIPFSGDSQLWHLLPSTYASSTTFGTVSNAKNGNSGFLEIVVKQAADEPLESIKTALDQRMQRIRFYLTHQSEDLATYEPQLRRQIAGAISARRSRLTKHDDLSNLLGIPEIESSVPDANISTPARRAPAATMRIPRVVADAEAEAWDVFISHASEDKESFARPLAEALRVAGLRVWFDETALRVGDSLRRSIDRGLAKSRFGVVVISSAFLAKEWPQRELDGLVAREEDGERVVLPIWHGVTASDVRGKSPTLADRLAIPSTRGINSTVTELLRVIRPE